MSDIKVTIDDKLVVNMQARRAKLVAAVRALVQGYGLEMAGQVRQELKSGKNIATGDLAKSIDSKTQYAGGLIEAKVTSDLPYSVFVHEGTRPHWVPINALTNWVRVKRLAGRYSDKTKRRLGGKYAQLSEDSVLARAIQRKIARVGTAAHPFFTRTFERVGDSITARLTRDISQAVDKL